MTDAQELLLNQEVGEVEDLPQRQGLRLVFHKVEYSVPSNRNRGTVAYLLSNVSGYFEPGQMAALIGPSGSGKTTLLDVLAGRKTQGTTTGEILYGGHPPSKSFLKKYTGYVEQFDTLLEMLTVKEMLLYTAELKRPVEEPYDQKKKHVEHLIAKLALEKVQHMKIGQQGGVKKRANIGISLITEPKVLFLDEPTTGLDSYTANETMNVVKNMALDGTTICSAIHSPTPFTFSLFDRVLFLLGGEVVFFGDRSLAANFLSTFSGDLQNTYDNEADWLTAIIVSAGRQQKGPEISKAYMESELHGDTYLKITHYVQNDKFEQSQLNNHNNILSETNTPMWFIVKTLIKYRTTKNLSNPMFWIPRFVDKVTFLLVFILTYYGMGDEYEDLKWRNVTSILFLLALFPAFGAAVYIPNIVLERAVLYRELDDGMYKTGAFLMMKIIDESVVAVFSAVLTTVIAYYGVCLEGDYFYLFIVYFGHMMNGIASAYIVAFAGSDVNMVNALYITYMLIVCFFTGPLVLPRDIPAYWKWLLYVSYARYGFGVLMYNQFNSSDKAKDAGVPLMDYDPSRGFRMTEISILEYHELEDVKIERWTLIVYLFVIGHLIVAYLCARFIRYQKR